MTTPSDAEQSTKRQRQEVIPKESQQVSSSSCAATDTSMQIPDPQILKPARPLSPAEREDSIPKRQRPAEVITVLTTAGVHSGNEIATLTDDQNALHTAKVNELVWWGWWTDRNRNKFSRHAGYQNGDWTDHTK